MTFSILTRNELTVCCCATLPLYSREGDCELWCLLSAWLVTPLYIFTFYQPPQQPGQGGSLCPMLEFTSCMSGEQISLTIQMVWSSIIFLCINPCVKPKSSTYHPDASSVHSHLLSACWTGCQALWHTQPHLILWTTLWNACDSIS